MNHSASGSFLGTFYQQAEERGYSFPGAGSYNLDKSTVSRPATSCTKPSTLSRRPKISCASMGAARMTASLCGADQLLLEPGPEFGPAPRSEFDDAAGGRGYCTVGGRAGPVYTHRGRLAEGLRQHVDEDTPALHVRFARVR